MLLSYSSTPDRFTLTEHRTLGVIVGGMLAIAGIVVLWLAITQGARTSDYVIGIPGTVLGLGIVVAWPRRVSVFDRTAGIARLTTLAGPRVIRAREIPLTDIVGVVLERGRVRYNTPVFDPALVLRSGERVLLTVNATGFFGLEQDAARAVREWLGLKSDAPLPARPVSTGAARTRRAWRIVGRSVAAAVMVAGFVIAALGALMASAQSNELRTSQPTRALVLGDSLDVWRERSGGERVRPMVHYQYVAAGATHESWRVWPVSRRGSRAWADSLIARFPAGDSVTAYTSPRYPWRSFLDPTPTEMPWGIIIFGGVVLLLGGIVFRAVR